jgi:hypothetical protein
MKCVICGCDFKIDLATFERSRWATGTSVDDPVANRILDGQRKYCGEDCKRVAEAAKQKERRAAAKAQRELASEVAVKPKPAKPVAWYKKQESDFWAEAGL